MKEYTEEEKSFNLLFESTIKSHWNRPALTDYQGQTLTYANVAEQVEQFHLLFQRLGIERGEKISLCGKNCSNWQPSLMVPLQFPSFMSSNPNRYRISSITQIHDYCL